MLLTLFGIVMVVSPLQPSNAYPLILVTPFGMVTVVRPVQLLNARSPILVTLFGISIEIRLLQFINVPYAIPNVPSSIVILVLAGIVPLYIYATFPAYTNPSG